MSSQAGRQAGIHASRNSGGRSFVIGQRGSVGGPAQRPYARDEHSGGTAPSLERERERARETGWSFRTAKPPNRRANPNSSSCWQQFVCNEISVALSTRAGTHQTTKLADSPTGNKRKQQRIQLRWRENSCCLAACLLAWNKTDCDSSLVEAASSIRDSHRGRQTRANLHGAAKHKGGSSSHYARITAKLVSFPARSRAGAQNAAVKFASDVDDYVGAKLALLQLQASISKLTLVRSGSFWLSRWGLSETRTTTSAS